MDEKQRIPRLELLYQQYLADHDAATFIRRTSEAYTVGTLCRLASADRRAARRAAVLALGFLADFQCNAVLGKALVDIDRGVRLAAENGIRSLWNRDGNEEQQQLLTAVAQLNGTQQFAEAIEKASDLITQAPWFAEAWNQRAIANYSLGDYEAALWDCHETLEINPYHFGAASGMGQCQLQMGNTHAALECFRRALKLNPNLEGVRANVVHLERSLQRE